MALSLNPEEHGLLASIAGRFELLKDWIRQFYEAETPNGVRFRYGLLVLDIFTVLFIVVTSFATKTSSADEQAGRDRAWVSIPRNSGPSMPWRLR